MKDPHANAGAFARNLVNSSDLRVPQSFQEINVTNPDLVRDFPIIATHWFGMSMEAA